jgi:hypothetical protein
VYKKLLKAQIKALKLASPNDDGRDGEGGGGGGPSLVDVGGMIGGSAMPLQVQEIDYREADADADANMHLDGTTAYAVALAGGGYASSPQRHRGNGGKSGGSPGRRRAGRGGARQ